MSYEQKLGKFQIPIDKFISDSMCQYIQNDLEILENVSEEIVRPDIAIADAIQEVRDIVLDTKDIVITTQ